MKQFTSHIDFSLTKKRFEMMVKQYSPFRNYSKKLVLLPVLMVMTLMFCTNQQEIENPVRNLSDRFIEKTTYSDIDLHYDGNRSEELGVYFGAQYTPDGELFTGTQRYYYVENDSIHSELYFEDGINTGYLMFRDGNRYRNKSGVYENRIHITESYINDILLYQDIPPSENEDGLGRVRSWHRNGQLGLEVFYTGNKEYQGLMTTYDEEGNIIEQKRYEDGEVVEEIR